MAGKAASGQFKLSFWLTLVSFCAFAIAFGLYVMAEKEVDDVNENRFVSHELTDELIRTSEDLTRFARAYVITGDTVYRQYFNEVMEVREGKRPRLPFGEYAFHDLTPTLESGSPAAVIAPAKSILQLLREAGLSDKEFELLLVAKTNSDILTKLEKQAMEMAENPGRNVDLGRERAIRLLFDQEYRAAKLNILAPVSEAHRLMSIRLDIKLEESKKTAKQILIAFLLLGLVTLGLFWRAYRQLQKILGGNVVDLQQCLAALGRGQFDTPSHQPEAPPHSIMAGIQATRQQLARIDQELRAELEKSHRINQMYLALAQCNQSILRIEEKDDLFPRICQDAVILAGLKVAWVALCDPLKQEMQVVSECSSGMPNGIDEIPGEVVQRQFDFHFPYCCRGEAVWYPDIHDPVQAEGWRALAQQYHCGAIAALPLLVNHQAIGSFIVCAENPAAFDEVVRTLLTEFAVDVGHVLNRFELEKERQHSLQIEELRSFLLEKVTASLTLHHFLEEAVNKVEAILPHCYCTVMLLDKDGVSLRCGAMPSLPVFFSEAIDGLKVGPGKGSCGNAIATGERTIAEDIAVHPFWRDYWPLAQRAGLRSCWSEPIISTSGKIYGAFAIYHADPRAPSAFDLQLLEMAAGLAALAIEHRQSLDAQHKLSQAVEQSSNAILITDSDIQIEYANASYLQNTGRRLQDIIGSRPSILSSGKTPPATYQEMWDQLRKGESWKGELINRYTDGTEHVDLTHISPIRDAKGHVTHFLAIQEDITDKKRNDERIRYLAHFDLLTGLPNRSLLEERARAAISHAERNQRRLALLFLDLDHFKDVNDTLGHSIGDSLLVEVASRLRQNLREEDVLSRLGGDEFIVMLTDVDEKSTERIAQKLISLVSTSFAIGGYELNVTPSIGIAVYPEDGADLETLLRNADAAMYRSKTQGRNTFSFFTREMQERSARHLELVNALRHALAGQQFALHYQPQISLTGRKLAGAEALLRWTHPVLGVVSPAEFIPVAEESGLILEIGEWVLRTALQQLKVWRDHGLLDFCMAVNLSAVQFRNKELPSLVQRLLEETGVPPDCLELELTESMAMHDPAAAIAMMNQLHAQGVRLSIDDFGTGYSSLSYLKQFKVYKLKIDKSFVHDVSEDPEDEAIISAVISMAHKLEMITIAEGVETPDQLSFLQGQGCDEIQGYLFSRPLPPDAFMRWVEHDLKTYLQ
ncbi:sensor domain-containing phosphodiesterase [Undibacterium squillarum]|uniref:sensor domain-containing phosphodiesterase n=1 Tax=Undibacterium squillarum TaxID=1131567 RepID=UPI0035AFEF96